MRNLPEDIIKKRSSLLKTSTSLANITAKIVFLTNCLSIGVLPKGFRLKFSLQSGLPQDVSEEFGKKIDVLLHGVSIDILRQAKEADWLKLNLLYSQLEENFRHLENKEHYAELAVAKFRKILILRMKVHQNKLRKLQKNLPPMVTNAEEEVNVFALKIADWIRQPGPNLPVIDWFDNPDFPPLLSPSRPDWTRDIVEQNSLSQITIDDELRSPVVSQPVSTVNASSGISVEVSHQSPSLDLPSTSIDEESNILPASNAIQIIPYSSENFKPLVLHEINVSDGVISLLKKGPTFTPTPLDPPDIATMEVDVDNWKEHIRWAYLFRKQQLKDDPQAELISTDFVKPPWYTKTDRKAPKASEEIELFMDAVATSLLSPSNFQHFPSNISSEEAKAFTELRQLKAQGVSVFLQDKSSRFVLANQHIIAEKVDADLSDPRYARLEVNDVQDILKQVDEWYLRYKSHLSGVDSDIRNWLVNEKSKPGKLKALLKTHKPGLPVREVFSVCSQPVEHLSALLQHCYLGPIVNSGRLKWRLKDTTHLIQFLHTVNDYIVENRINSPLSICSVDIKNMFPSIYKDLAFPAIKKQLTDKGYSTREVQAVMEGLRIVRDGTRINWKGQTVKQLDGCSLGPADSCDYSDISLDAFLQVVVPKIEESLGLDLRFLRFFRDDGLLLFFGENNLIIDMLKILNAEREELIFTTEMCPCGDVLGCCETCPQILPYLDCSISIYMRELDDGVTVPQLKTTTFSKSTDVHHYIEPTSCTPKLNKKSPAIIKGVAHRLRVTNMLDEDLINTLNVFSGYLIASGYDKQSVLQYFGEVLSVSNRSLVFKKKQVDTSFKIALVTKMHPALPNVNKIFDRYYPIIQSCPVSSKILPRNSLIYANRKLRDLSSLLASNPFYSAPPPTTLKGFQRTTNCACYVCKEAFFTDIAYSPAYPERGLTISRSVNCESVNVVYMVTCWCGKHYVGRTGNPKKRWSNHKSHIRNGRKTCNLATHCIESHSEIMVGKNKLWSVAEIKKFLKFTVVDTVGEDGTEEELKLLEDRWKDNLHSWAPIGLNTRED